MAIKGTTLNSHSLSEAINSPMMKLEERPKISIAFEHSPKEQSEKGGRKLEV